jgi:hypothetical protein
LGIGELRDPVLEWLALWIGIGYCKMFERRFTIKMEYRDYLLGLEDATCKMS